MTARRTDDVPTPGEPCLNQIDVAVLAGGLGSRMRNVLGDTPKILAPIDDRPFLDHLLAWLVRYGARRVVLCLGHLADKVIEYREAAPEDLVPVHLLVEPEPLGTGGALRFARNALNSDPVLVMNGDTWIDADLCDFVRSHREAALEASILCVEVNDVAPYGKVDIAPDRRMIRFTEKDRSVSGRGIVSAGVYLFSRAVLARLDGLPGPSLERDFLQNLPARSVHCHAVRTARFFDLGTPENLLQARASLAMGRVFS